MEVDMFDDKNQTTVMRFWPNKKVWAISAILEEVA